MSEPLISVIIPSYNYANYIEQGIISVAFQNYKNIELIVIDDCSTDNSLELLARCKEKYEKEFAAGFFVYKNPVNLGAHRTINEGIKHAKGKYISILNADDMYLPERFCAIMECMGNARFAYTSVKCINENGLPFGENSERYDEAKTFEDLSHKGQYKNFLALGILGENVCISTGNMVFEKTLFEELQGFRNFKYVHDYDFLMRASLVTEPVFVSHTAYLYRLHTTNSFSSLAKEGLRENRVLWLEFYNKILKGKLTNAKILSTKDYLEKFSEEINGMGKKKQVLWKMSKHTPVMACVNVYKKIIHVGDFS